MNQEKVLVAYGDGHGPTVIRAAESIIQTVAPDLELCHTKIGAGAYFDTTYALPSDALDLISNCNVMLSGPVNMGSIPERDPIVTIKKQMGLFMEYGEFFPLCKRMSRGSIDLVVTSPTVENALNVYETVSLDGVASELYTSAETATHIFAQSAHLARMRHRNKICLVSDNVLYPIREKLIRDSFHSHFAYGNIDAVDSSTREIIYGLTYEPASVDTLICDIHSSTCIWGLASGLVGGNGLMPHAFVGDKMRLYTTGRVFPYDGPDRKLNPTSAILSSAVMLLHMGKEDCYHTIVDAVRGMYHMGRTTPDVGGKLSPKQFTEGVRELILSELQQ